MPASSSSTDPSASLLSRPKLKKAAPRKRRPKGEAPADYAGDAVSHRQGDPDAADADSLADQLFASLGEPRSRSPPSSSTLASPSSATISGSDDDRGSPREKGSSIASKLSTLGDEIKDALVPHGPKRNRHKERLAKRRHDTDMARRGAMQEVAAAGPDADKGRLEDRAIAEACQGLGVDLFEISPDGHCLFSAIADQLNIFHAPPTPFTPANLDPASNPFGSPGEGPPKGPHTYASCRKAAAEYMRAHRNEFLPYLPGEDDGGDGLMTEDEYAKHCDLMEKTAEWGGEPEILALSRCFRYPIHVVQANSPTVKVGTEDFASARDGVALLISYHRFNYGLGEHYNSLRPKQGQRV